MPGISVLIVLLLLLAAAAGLIWWMTKQSSKKTVDSASRTISSSRVTPPDTSFWMSRWIEAVVGTNGLELFSSGQNLIVYGAESAGRQTLMTKAVDALNSQFAPSQCAAIYIDMRGIVALASPQPWLSAEVLYRQLISAPIMWYRGLTGQSAGDSRLRQLEARLEKALARPLSEIDFLGVRTAFEDWLDELRIQKLFLFLDFFSELTPDLAPQLLYLLTKTFPRGSREVFILGGRRERLVIEQLTEGKRIGLQLNHDIQIGFDLDQLLQASDLRASRSDPRQAFLLACLSRSAPRLTGVVDAGPTLNWEAIFNPAEAWFDLFQACDFDVEQVGAALSDLLPNLAASSRRRISENMIRTSVRRVRNQAQLQ